MPSVSRTLSSQRDQVIDAVDFPLQGFWHPGQSQLVWRLLPMSRSTHMLPEMEA
jgi:hypothetical protein